MVSLGGTVAILSGRALMECEKGRLLGTGLAGA